MARIRKGDRKVLRALRALSERVGDLFPHEIVKGDYFDLPGAFELAEVAESEGIISPIAAEQLRGHLRSKWIAYTTGDLPENKALIPRDFAPSYEEYTRDDYRERVQEASRRAALDAHAYHEARDKREAHYSIPGGRRGLRYPEEARHALTAATEKRLAGLERPFDARTQSPKVRKRVKGVPYKDAKENGKVRDYNAGSYRDQVRRALKTLTEGLFEWEVPADVAPLIQAGMPRKEAAILVRRAANRVFFVEDLTEPTGNVRPFVRALPKGWPSLAGQVETCFRVTLTVVDDELTADPHAHPEGPGGDLQRVGITEDDPSGRARRVAGRPRGGYSHPLSAIPDRSRIIRISADGREIIDADWLEKNRDAWAGPVDVFQYVQAELDRIRPSSLEITFSRGGITYQASAKVTQQTDESGREHSKLLCRGVPKNRIDYRTLKGALLSDLPDTLCRIARRPKPTSARRNPMANWWNSDQYDLDPEFALGPVGPRARRPTSRRNSSAKTNRGRPVRRARKAAKGKKISAYNAFVGRLMKQGYTMKQAAAAWKIHKKGGSPARHKEAWGKVRASKKRASKSKSSSKRKSSSKLSAYNRFVKSWMAKNSKSTASPQTKMKRAAAAWRKHNR